jgi:hypothetical protein
VPREPDYYNRLIRSDGAIVNLSLRPRGSQLRDLSDDVRFVQWFTAWPGVISIVGWMLHHTVFRSRWIVSVGPANDQLPMPVVQVASLPKREAERVFLRLADWLHDGHAVEAFRIEAP